MPVDKIETKEKGASLSAFSVIVSFIALALLGCALLPLLPVRLAPSETLPSVTVSFSMSGSSARTVEAEATDRLESALSRITGVRHIKSRSSQGRGQVTIELDRNADIGTARFEAAMTVRQIWGSLPDNASYPQIAVRQVDDAAARPFMSYTVNAPLTPSEIKRYAEDNIRPALVRIPGIARVELSGAMPMEWRIDYDNAQMEIIGISEREIQAAISAYYGREYLGMVPVDDGEGRLMRLSVGGRASDGPPDLSRITVATRGGQVVTLDKIATLSHTEAAPTGYFRINGLNSVYLNITSADDANQIDLSKRVEQTLASLSLPPGYMLNLSYDASESISKELDKIYFRTGLTVLILLAFVGLITLSWRYLLMIAISLTLNMAVAVVAYYMLGVEIQLYSLAGITISLNLLIDNLIVMAEHIMRHHDRRAFTAILAATLTTVGALSVVFFLDEKTMLSLKDFVIVVIVNLTVSLAVALFFVPALVERMGVVRRKARRNPLSGAGRVAMKAYGATARWFCRHRALLFTAIILAFGLPVFMLPEKLEGEGRWVKLYNSTIGSPTYKESVRPWVDRCLGGTLRLFADKVSDGSYFSRGHDEPTISINATLPNGATLEQMNSLIRRMEDFLASSEGVRQFQTSISGPRRGSITVMFKPEYQRTGYPYRLKSDAIAKALTLGGGSWSVYGLEDNGFNNNVSESAGSYRIQMTGYNYDDLYSWAEAMRDSLLTVRRIREVNIKTDFSYYKDDYTEFYLSVDPALLARDSLAVSDIYTAVSRDFGKDIGAGIIPGPDGAEAIKLSSAGRGRDVWGLINMPIQVGRRMIKLSDYATVEQRQTPPDIVKEDQEYILCLQYEYVGSNKQGERVLKNKIDAISPILPLGYRAEKGDWTWQFGNDATHYALLGLIIAIIFFISAILFNSLLQPIAIILVIPVSFIGVFLTFYLFDLRFDQGGFAAFILLCGITVNAAIYIINEYNSLRRARPWADPTGLYLEAFGAKITAVLLTVLSTVLGFIPFLVGDTREGFWFPLAAGTMGGLVMSLVAIFFLLPTLVIPRRKRNTTHP